MAGAIERVFNVHARCRDGGWVAWTADARFTAADEDELQGRVCRHFRDLVAAETGTCADDLDAGVARRTWRVRVSSRVSSRPPSPPPADRARALVGHPIPDNDDDAS